MDTLQQSVKTKSYPLDRLGEHIHLSSDWRESNSNRNRISFTSYKKIDWILCWPEYDRTTNCFVVRELVSVKETT